MSALRVAVLTHGFAEWGGGIDLIRQLALALDSCAGEADISATCLVLPSNDLHAWARQTLRRVRAIGDSLKGKNSHRGVRSEHEGRGRVLAALGDLSHRLPFECHGGSTMVAQLRCAERAGAEIAFPCIEVPGYSEDISWVGYLYDFQHRYLPEFFTDKERLRRDFAFERMLHAGVHVLVNSRAVVEDARKFFPGFTSTVHALPFSPCPQKEWLEDDVDPRPKYGLRRPYFMISNQFWIHKNHALAFRAFARFLESQDGVDLVCTGNTGDYRFPGYFADLQKLVLSLGVSDHLKILGHLDKREQIALMKHASAVIQPTLFEGGPGGGAAHDAVALGVPLIASDIPVNREIDTGDVRFFPAHDECGLAELLSGVELIEHRQLDRQGLWLTGLERRKASGRVLVKLLKEATRDARGKTAGAAA